MILNKLDNWWIASTRSFMNSTDRRILKNVLQNGRTYPGDVLKSLGISPTLGLKKIIELRHKGYLIRDKDASTIRINPEKRKVVKIVTVGI